MTITFGRSHTQKYQDDSLEISYEVNRYKLDFCIIEHFTKQADEI